MKALNVSQLVSKLNHVMNDRFGVDVQYIPMSERCSDRSGTLETVRRNAGAPLIVAHNQMIVPLRIEGTLVGATRVPEINRLLPGELSQIKDTIDLIIGEAIVSRNSLFDEEPSNVLQFAELNGRKSIAQTR